MSLQKKGISRKVMKKSKNNLAMLRKFSYNFLRIAMIREKRSDLMTEMMDEFCDNHALFGTIYFTKPNGFCQINTCDSGKGTRVYF